MHARRSTVLAALAAAGVLAAATATIGATTAGAEPKAGNGTVILNITRGDTKTVDSLEGFTPPGKTPITGDFVGDDTLTGNLDDILWYTPGAGGDALWRTKGDRSWAATSISVTGTFQPLVADFSSDGKDDIFWYAPGSTAESLWDFNPDGSITKTAFSVSGTYTPIVGEFTDDGGDDILWYAPGPAADSWWDINVDGTVTQRAFSVKGTFTPVVGQFSGVGSPTFDFLDDVFWYAPGTAPDSVWDWNPDGTITQRPLTINGTYRVVAGNFTSDGFEDLLFYAPGTAADSLWDFDSASLAKTQKPLAINGTYDAVLAAPMFDQSEQTDVLFFRKGAAGDTIWDFGGGNATFTNRAISLSGNRLPVLASLEAQGNDTGADVLDLFS